MNKGKWGIIAIILFLLASFVSPVQAAESETVEGSQPNQDQTTGQPTTDESTGQTNDETTNQTPEQTVVAPQSIQLEKTELLLQEGEKAALTATVLPEAAANKNVTWESSNSEVATVDENGEVTAIKAGAATITVQTEADATIKASIPVTVTKNIPTTLKLNKTTLDIATKQTVKVTATVDTADQTIVWASSNPKVASVDQNGNIQGITQGTATITAVVKDNPDVYQTVSVKVSPKTVKVNKTSMSLTAGKTATLAATVSPKDSTYKTVTWKSSNTRIATVNSKGKVTAKTKGKVTITASAKDAKAASVTVNVTAPIPAKTIKLNKKAATLKKGQTLVLKATVGPSNTTNKTVKWKSSNTKVVKVDSKGKVTAVGAGTAKITATTTNGKAASATITVPYVKSLGAGIWKTGKDLPAGRYRITTPAGSGVVLIDPDSDERFIEETLTSKNDGEGVKVITTDVKNGDYIEITGLKNVEFTRVAHVKTTSLNAGHWTVGKDVPAGKYRITTSNEVGFIAAWRGDKLFVFDYLSSVPYPETKKSVTTTFKNGDHIFIAGMDKVTLTKK